MARVKLAFLVGHKGNEAFIHEARPGDEIEEDRRVGRQQRLHFFQLHVRRDLRAGDLEFVGRDVGADLLKGGGLDLQVPLDGFGGGIGRLPPRPTGE